MKRLAAAAVALAALSGHAFATEWTVDQANSTLGFEVVIDGTTISGTFTSWTAMISFDPNDLAAAHAKVTVDLASAHSGNETRDKALKTDVWFDIAKTPTAEFDTTAFRNVGGPVYEAEANLTIRGVANAVALPFSLSINGDEAHMTARMPLIRTRWGVGQGEYEGDTPVATNVDVVIDLTALAKAP